MNQRSMYNGHDKIYCIKVQSFIGPDGMYMDIPLPFSTGCTHDSLILTASRLNQRLADLQQGRRVQYVYYGDKGYPIETSHGRGAFRRTVWMTPEQRLENRVMKVPRGMAAEVGFSKPAGIMSQSDYHKQNKLRKSNITHIYLVSCILCNIHSCMYGNSISEYFNIETPSLEDYLQI
jgi:nuclease HARBI1